MTWLSEIEANNKEFREEILDGSDLALEETEKERMARVIRELVEKIREARNIANDAPEGDDSQVLDDALTNIVLALRDEWSPDAKELLEQ